MIAVVLNIIDVIISADLLVLVLLPLLVFSLIFLIIGLIVEKKAIAFRIYVFISIALSIGNILLMISLGAFTASYLLLISFVFFAIGAVICLVAGIIYKDPAKIQLT